MAQIKRNAMEIVWVFGSSGAGKETLIRGLSRAQQPLALAQQVGWQGQTIVVCEESLRLIAQSENDPMLDKRANLVSFITPLAKNDTVVLIKGQDVDLERDVPRQVQSLLPQAKHRLWFVDVPAGTLFQRWKKKPWWNDDFTLKTVQQWQDHQLSLLRAIEPNFASATIRSVDANTYTISEGLPLS